MRKAVVALTGGAALAAAPREARASTQPFVGEMMMTAITFVPQGWLPCDGRLLSIATYTDLFSIIGTMYGGDGVTTFALPDLRGRAPIHPGQGLGLSNRIQGEAGGRETEVVLANQMPVHDHAAMAGSSNGTSDIPSGLYPAVNPAGSLIYGNGADSQLGAPTSSAGGNQPHENVQPYLAIHFCICPNGVYPSRS